MASTLSRAVYPARALTGRMPGKVTPQGDRFGRINPGPWTVSHVSTPASPIHRIHLDQTP